MSDAELLHLIKMVNQISENLNHGEATDAAQKVADHLTRFWAPSMKEKIIQHKTESGEGLSDLTKLAIDQLVIQLATQ